MKPKITARSFQLFVLTLLGLVLAACRGVRSTAATPTVQVALTQTATRIPTRYITFTPSPPSPTPTPRATTKPTQSPSSAYTQTPRPSLSAVAWSVAATDVDVSSLEYGLFSLHWQSDVIVEINGVYIDTRTREIQPPPPSSRENPHTWYSPDSRYLFDCGGNKLRLYQGEQLLGEADGVFWCWDIQWRDDSQVASIVGDDGLYAWWVSRPTPTKISGKLTGPASWSPDGQRLAYAFCDFLNEKAYADILSVINWQRLSRIEVSGCGATWEAILYWLNNDILVEPLRYGADLTAYEYYDAISGRSLGYYIDAFDFPSQKPVLSPDGRWHVLEQTNGVMGTNYIYAFYDLQSKDGYILSDSPTHYIAFMAWAEDNSAFYLVHSPADETVKTGADFPFGLLALNPQSREFTPLFEQAAFAKLSPDKDLAWVVFPAKHADGALGLDGGIFNLADGTLVGRQFVSDGVIYANPAEGDLVPAAWSNDGTRVVFGDSQGNLTLVRIDGTPQVLATNLPHDGWPGNAHYAWSPDDRYLLVQSGNRAWIVSVP